MLTEQMGKYDFHELDLALIELLSKDGDRNGLNERLISIDTLDGVIKRINLLINSEYAGTYDIANFIDITDDNVLDTVDKIKKQIIDTINLYSSQVEKIIFKKKEIVSNINFDNVFSIDFSFEKFIGKEYIFDSEDIKYFLNLDYSKSVYIKILKYIFLLNSNDDVYRLFMSKLGFGDNDNNSYKFDLLELKLDEGKINGNIKIILKGNFGIEKYSIPINNNVFDYKDL